MPLLYSAVLLLVHTSHKGVVQQQQQAQADVVDESFKFPGPGTVQKECINRKGPEVSMIDL